MLADIFSRWYSSRDFLYISSLFSKSGAKVRSFFMLYNMDFAIRTVFVSFGLNWQVLFFIDY